MNPILTPEEQAEFLAARENVKQTAQNHLNTNRNLQFAINFVANLQRGVDHVVKSTIDQGLELDCKAGCSHCCHVRVEALEPEVFRIARELKNLSSDQINELIERLHIHAAQVKDLPVTDHHTPCPFLENNLCTIYSVRPAVCRKVHSFDVEKCKTPGAEIPQRLDITLKSEALTKGTADAYCQTELPTSGHELGQSILLALTDETAESRWYGGTSVFTGL